MNANQSAFGIHAPRISRRTMLRGAGVAVALPALECMQPRVVAQSGQDEPRRMIAINFELSFHQPNLIPQQTGRNYTLPMYLQPLADVRNDFTVISGTSHPEVDGGHLASISWLTGAPHPAAAGFRNSISIDQFAAKHIGHQTRFATRQMHTGISVSSNGVIVYGNPIPVNHFNDMFLEGRPNEKAKQIQRLQDGQSILDVVLESSKRMQQRVSRQDKRKIDEYLVAVREAEKSLQKSEQWQNRPRPKVDAKPPSVVQDKARVMDISQQFYDMMFLALQTDSTRLMTYVVGGSIYVPIVLGVSQNYHSLSHHSQDPEKIKQLGLVEGAYVKLFGDFISRLKQTQEGGSSLLDRTQILFGSHMHDGLHSNQNLPIILAGGGFPHGQHLTFDKDNNTPLANLYVSMLQRLGLPIDRFASSTGTLSGLEANRG